MRELDIAVIGAGFAGLGTAAALRASGLWAFAVLEQGEDVAHAWSRHYDRLHLHSPWHDMPHDGGANRRYAMYKPRDAVQHYLRDYAHRHELGEHLRFGERVLHVEQIGSGNSAAENASASTRWCSRPASSPRSASSSPMRPNCSDPCGG